MPALTPKREAVRLWRLERACREGVSKIVNPELYHGKLRSCDRR